MPAATLSLAGCMHAELRRHLFPRDGLEAAAILVCARVPGPRLRLIARQALLVPYEECTLRERDAITWPGAWIEQAIDAAEDENLALILVHSHPGGFFGFSEADDRSDQSAVTDIFHAYGELHGSAIMVPGGAMRARYYTPDGSVHSFDLVSVAGDDLSFWWDDEGTQSGPTPRPMAFTGSMTHELGRLSAGLIGASGTGSITGEQLSRLGFGRITAIDFDKIEERNLNRILNSGPADVGRLKVDVFADAVLRSRGPDIAIAVPSTISSRAAVLAASQCDVLFCCVDTLEARYFADQIATAFLVPLIDMGVVIPTRQVADGIAIAEVQGRIDYIQPGGSSLADREIYSPESLRAEYLRRVAPSSHKQEVEAGYIEDLQEEAPSVISLNMRAASAAVNEFIARAYPFRHDPNSNYARTQFSLAAGEEEYFPERSFKATPRSLFARGATEPLLALPALQIPSEAS